MSSIAPRSLARALFVPDGDGYHQCRICFSRRKQARGTGYTNLVEHLVRCHANTYEDEFRPIQRRGGSLGTLVKGDEFSRTIYHWLDWIIMENRELSMCEKAKTRKYTRLSRVSVKTLKKNMFGLKCRSGADQVATARQENWLCYRRMDRGRYAFRGGHRCN
ncbi:hypothetical protein GN958_ATG03816 [Phytophthora infestans]|uniref:BED-type domain-containing protein n=1 Tax=Phytophthora infestans TaxID=4787 RepID=A0A8S9UDT2_PHYIN|nr:hypothetical protein GN958_ATG11575 [Phytophthora infestans]KAF4146997.1 hypothetical protein GN958_ATG03816 [Phytophthora infestans]